MPSEFSSDEDDDESDGRNSMDAADELFARKLQAELAAEEQNRAVDALLAQAVDDETLARQLHEAELLAAAAGQQQGGSLSAQGAEDGMRGSRPSTPPSPPIDVEEKNHKENIDASMQKTTPKSYFFVKISSKFQFFLDSLNPNMLF